VAWGKVSYRTANIGLSFNSVCEQAVQNSWGDSVSEITTSAVITYGAYQLLTNMAKSPHCDREMSHFLLAILSQPLHRQERRLGFVAFRHRVPVKILRAL